MDISELIAARKTVFEDYLDRYLKDAQSGSEVFEAFAYSLRAGGKRIRPVLVMLATEAAGGHEGDALPAGLAIEMIHTFSLIHDDLPALDDDELRRGLPTCHKKFGEAMAILAGDALIFQALSVILTSPYAMQVKLDLCTALADVCGTNGLVQGEYEDVMAEGIDLPLDRIEGIYTRKTSRLFELCMYAGARIAREDPESARSLAVFGSHLGRAFQAIDDILDVTSDRQTLGKSPGKDLAKSKATVVKVLGIDGARSWAQEATGRAVKVLDGIVAVRTEVLRELAFWMLGRVM
ncbi:MAG TPA: farnesyl diphosphate synthase [Desulfomonilia bacterium]|nr:farnesyl diphosphate synthase [Desulfomonilia bacterium]